MKIEAYEFGRMVYGGKTYTSDLIIYPDRVDSSCWRLKKQLEEKGIGLYVEKTGKAVEVFNSADKSKKVIGAFRLTC